MFSTGQPEGGRKAKEGASAADGVRRVPPRDCHGDGGQEEDQVRGVQCRVKQKQEGSSQLQLNVSEFQLGHPVVAENLMLHGDTTRSCFACCMACFRKGRKTERSLKLRLEN